MIDYFVERLPGVDIDRSSKKFYYDFYDSSVSGKLPMAPLGLADDFRFLRKYTDREAKFCVTGPHSLTKRIRNNFYPSEEALAMDIARVMNLELKELVKGRRENNSNRRAVLLRLSRRHFLGRECPQRDGRRRRRHDRRPHLLRQSLRQAVLGRQLSLSVSEDSRRENPAADASNSRVAAAKTWPSSKNCPLHFNWASA